MRSGVFLVLCGASLAACASLGVKKEVIVIPAQPVASQAIDLKLSRRSVNDRDVWTYSLSVLLQERHGVGLVFDEIQTTVYQHGFTPWSPAYYGVWRLAPNGKIGIPLQVSLTCSIIPAGGVTVPVTLALWHLTLVGRSDQGRPAKIWVLVALPPMLPGCVGLRDTLPPSREGDLGSSDAGDQPEIL